ncbi:FtsX-like permease family protein [bacterium]|nr:FtsX-like permease family protein [bacterium]MBU1958215.1 FtsX-like permease family protein [bacterium]
MKNINLYLVEFAINALLRAKSKNIFILVVFTLLTSLLTAVFLITGSIKHELQSTVQALPQITVQKIKAGRHYDIDTIIADDIINIAGVSEATPRVWGYYYFENAGVNFSLLGIDQYEQQYKESLSKVVETYDFDTPNSEAQMIVGQGVQKIMQENYYKDYFNFIKPDGSFKKVTLAGVFDAQTQLESNDMILMSKENVREIFGISENRATDIVVKVPNPEEVSTIASKIKMMYPDTRVISSNDLQVSYQNIFDYKSGVFLALFTIALFTFFMIIYDKTSGLSSEEKREIGILKAIGWRVDDILKEKFYEAFIVSFLAYTLGVILAFGFVYLFQAPLLREIFVGYSQLKTSFELPFIFDLQMLFLVFFLSVPIYIAATIIPSWRAATLEVDEIIR